MADDWRTRRRNGPLPRTFWIGAGIFGVSLLLVGYGCHHLQAVSERLGFFPIPVTIQRVAVGEASNPDPEAAHMCYFPEVRYRYTVGERSYVGSNYAVFVPCHADKVFVQNQVGRLHPGQRMTGHYNPANPTQSYLFKAYDDTTHFILIGIGAVGMLLSLLAGLDFIRMRSG